VKLLTAEEREGAWWLRYAVYQRPGELRLRVDAESSVVTKVLDTVRDAAPAP
jgi:hypothetical protein